MKKSLVIFQPGKVWKKIFGLLCIGIRKYFQDLIFDMHCDIFDKIDNFLTFILLTIIVPVFDLGMSFGKIKPGKRKICKKSGNLYSKLRRNTGRCKNILKNLLRTLQF